MNDLMVVQEVAEWQKLKTLVLDSVSSPITKRVYNMALDEFMSWFQHVKSLEEEVALGGGWGNSPNEFAPYRGARPTRTEQQDARMWIDDWTVPGLLPSHRNSIKAQLLRADSVFWKSPDADSGDITAMTKGFEGVAQVLFEVGLLTEQLLLNEIPALVWDTAIAAGWYLFASETPEGIFPEQLGHYWIWRDESRDWNALFRAEQAKWLAELVESSSAAKSRSRVRNQVRPRRRDPGIQQIKERVRKLRGEGLSDKDICGRLGDGLRPPRAEWRDLRWPVAYIRHTSAVAKWLSEACR